MKNLLQGSSIRPWISPGAATATPLPGPQLSPAPEGLGELLIHRDQDRSGGLEWPGWEGLESVGSAPGKGHEGGIRDRGKTSGIIQLG